MTMQTNSKLEERIEALLQSEELTDDNKFVSCALRYPTPYGSLSGIIAHYVMGCRMPLDTQDSASCPPFVHVLIRSTWVVIVHALDTFHRSSIFLSFALSLT